MSPKIREILKENLEFISNDSLIKIMRQLDFWKSEELDEEALFNLAKKLVRTATILKSEFKVPQVRFGKTDLQMPIVSCGGMRIQKTWLSDTSVLAPSLNAILNHASQQNLVDIIRLCLKFGINHFETARTFGTSEIQFAHALKSLMDNGELKREDFIFQTQVPTGLDRQQFEKMFQQTWDNVGEILGHIDLFTFMCVSTKAQVENLLSHFDESCMAAALEYQAEGKIVHIGFSSHGTSSHIMDLINSEKFDYVNLHAHYFGDMHGEGTDNTVGGHGNKACVARALELDMGVANISCLDKGGMVYCPSKTMARLIGHDTSPIEFVELYSWKTLQFHTVSVGFARPSDLEETLAAVRSFAEEGEYQDRLQIAINRLDDRRTEVLGAEWIEKGMLHLPTCEEETSHGSAIGQMLWCHDLLVAFGMYDFCKARYASLEANKWNNKLSFEQNCNNFKSENMGRGYDMTVDYIMALSQHCDAKTAENKMSKAHGWLCKANQKKIDREALGFEQAYDLRPWTAYPGDAYASIGTVARPVLVGVFGGYGGPTRASNNYANMVRDEINK